MCSSSRWLYLVSLGLWGFAFFFLLSLPSAHAANVTYETVRVGSGQYAPSGVQAPVTVNVKGPGVSKFHQIVPTASPSTIGKLGRSLIRGGGVGLAVSGAIEGLGYLVDRATGEITKVVVVYPDPDYGDYIPGRGSDGGQCKPFKTGFTYTASSPNPNRPTYCNNGTEPQYNVKQWNCNDPAYPIGYDGVPYADFRANKCFARPSETGDPEEDIIDLDPSDYQRIDEHLDDVLSLAQKASILRQSVGQLAPSGTVSTDNYPVTITSTNTDLQQLYNDWPELRVALQELVNAALAEQLALADPEFSLSPDEQIIIDQGLDSPPLVPDSELPAFCEWAEFICRPFVGGDHPEVPTIDLELEEYDSELPGNATCPAPYTFETGFTGPIEISFQPACDLAAAIRVPLLAISYLMAGFIVVGVRR